jgi:hypothetical protein
MLTNVAAALAGVIGAGIVFIGARAFWAPQAAAGFGIPAGDALIVLRDNGPRAAVQGGHGSTAAVMLVISVLLLVA